MHSSRNAATYFGPNCALTAGEQDINLNIPGFAPKLVKIRRAGKSIFYSLADDHVRAIIGQGMERVME